jgi:WD40 repeat protein
MLTIFEPKYGKSARMLGIGDDHSGFAFAVAWSPDGKRIASASADGTVQIWKP